MAHRSEPTRGGAGAGRRFIQLLKPYQTRLGVTLAMVMGLTGVNLIVPQSLRMVFDYVFPNNAWSLLWLVLIILLGLYVLRNVLYFYSKYSAVAVGEDLSFMLRKRLFERLQQMSLQYYRDHKAGQLSSRVMNDSFVIQQFIQDQVPKLLQSVLLFIGLVVVMYLMNWPLALVATLVLPFHFITYRYFHGPIKQASRSASESMAGATGNLIEKFLGMEVVKGFTAEQRENEAFQNAIDQSRRNQLRGQKFQVGQKVVADLLIGVGMIGLLGFGAYQVMIQGMEEGAFFAFFWYVKMLYPTVSELMSAGSKLPKATASSDRVFELMESAEGEEAHGQQLRPTIEGSIRFDDVSFRYDDVSPFVLQNISFHINAGEVCAVVGPSGSGKSTLANLLPRFSEPSFGRVLIDNQDSRDLDRTHLRQHVGFAFQECFLFNTTILENLRYACPDASLEHIVDTAWRIGAHQFIEKLPHGYQTVVGEKGVSLSRGQKQLITLTRAMLKNPQILILDEATASVDEASESHIMTQIFTFMRDKTTIMITHRPDLLRHADRVVRLDEGRVMSITGPQPKESPEPQQLQSWRDRDKSSSGHWPAVTPLLAGAVLTGLLATASPAQDAAATQPSTTQPSATQPSAKSLQPWTERELGPAPEDAGQFLPQAELSSREVSEILELVTAEAKAQGYRNTAGELEAGLPATPSALRDHQQLMKQTEAGTKLLEVGFKTFTSQPTHVWLYGLIVKPSGQRVINPDVQALAKRLEQARQSQKQEKKQRDLTDLATRKLSLSYIGVSNCTQMLQRLGYNVAEGKQPAKMQNLPIVMPIPAAKNAGIVGNTKYGDPANRGRKGNSVEANLPNTAGAPMTKMLVFYDPARPEQFGRLRELVRDKIDVPARQIVIEAMVLEISETTLEKLGVEWELQSPFSNHSTLDSISNLRFGQLPSFDSSQSPSFDITIDGISNHWRAQLQALIRDGEARVLSRPSVLTLNNRQAYIRVGEDIPVARSASGLRSGDKLQFDFQYIPVGISLNVRPRVSAGGDMISMQVNGDVSAEVPGEDLVIFDQRGNELARAPRLSQRQVQTYTRIANNTPFIIGGLVSEDKTQETDKVPILGDIPVAGALFRDRTINALKREVIIVLTPYVLPEDQIVGRNLPKDEDAFDSFGNELFRDAYRIRSEDVFDLSFLTQSEHIQRLQASADKVINDNYDLRDQYPFDEFADGGIPGEQILVYRQMYEVVKRKALAKRIPDSKLIFFDEDEDAASGFSVEFLKPFLKEEGKQLSEDLLKKQGLKAFRSEDKALALIFTDARRSRDTEDILSQPVPELRVVECADGGEWSRKLWQLNQPTEEGQQRYTILLRDADDLLRLRRAVVLKRTVQLNSSRRSLTLDNFSVGRQLLLPEVTPDKVHLIDAEVAEYFYLTEQYYPALQKRVRDASKALRRALDKRHMAPDLEGSDPGLSFPER
jgi:subfamily B ATP-binding cassette protein MsbA